MVGPSRGYDFHINFFDTKNSITDRVKSSNDPNINKYILFVIKNSWEVGMKKNGKRNNKKIMTK